MATVKISTDTEKAIKRLAKDRGITPGEAADQLIATAVKRREAVNRYAAGAVKAKAKPKGKKAKPAKAKPAKAKPAKAKPAKAKPAKAKPAKKKVPAPRPAKAKKVRPRVRKPKAVEAVEPAVTETEQRSATALGFE